MEDHRSTFTWVLYQVLNQLADPPNHPADFTLTSAVVFWFSCTELARL